MERWTQARIHATVLERGWSDETGAYTGASGSDRLGASVLLMPIVGSYRPPTIACEQDRGRTR